MPALAPTASVAIVGDLTLDEVDEALARLRAAADDPAGGELEVDLGGVRRVDTFGMAALASVLRRLRQRGRPAQVTHAPPHALRLAEVMQLDAVLGFDADGAGARLPRIERVGAAALRLFDFLVALFATLALGYRHALPYALRGGSVVREQYVRHASEAGWDAAPLVILINFMLGAILAIQMAYALADYGVISYMPQFVAISMTREIGPLMTALLVAGRSGAGFAAEIGTMNVTEELDALTMMNLPPRRFLLLPRFGALALAVPALAVIGVSAGVVGGMVTGVWFYGLPWSEYLLDTGAALETRDLLSGLVKAFFFGNLIAAVGCLYGLTLRGGTDEVGRSATQAVVQAIIAVVVFDAAFTALTKEIL